MLKQNIILMLLFYFNEENQSVKWGSLKLDNLIYACKQIKTEKDQEFIKQFKNKYQLTNKSSSNN